MPYPAVANMLEHTVEGSQLHTCHLNVEKKLQFIHPYLFNMHVERPQHVTSFKNRKNELLKKLVQYFNINKLPIKIMVMIDDGLFL